MILNCVKPSTETKAIKFPVLHNKYLSQRYQALLSVQTFYNYTQTIDIRYYDNQQVYNIELNLDSLLVRNSEK